MSDRKRAKEWLNEMSSDNLDKILYFMNLVLTKKELITENCNLKNEKQQLISFLKNKINECNEDMNLSRIDNIRIINRRIVYQEVLDFVNRGGKNE